MVDKVVNEKYYEKSDTEKADLVELSLYNRVFLLLFLFIFVFT